MSVPSNELINQFVTELGYISVNNGYLNNFLQVRPDYLSLSNNNEFDFICVWQGNDKPGDFDNDNRPESSVIDIYIDVHIKSTDVSGDLTYKIESVKQDMLKWLYRGPGITANKWCMVGEVNTANTLAVWQGYTLENIIVAREADTLIALLRFPLKVQRTLDDWNFAGISFLGPVTLLTPANLAAADATLFTWQALSGATSYDIEFSQNGVVVHTQTLIPITYYSVPVGSPTLINPLTNYEWRVRGNNAIGHGAWSAQWSFLYS